MCNEKFESITSFLFQVLDANTPRFLTGELCVFFSLPNFRASKHRQLREVLTRIDRWTLGSCLKTFKKRRRRSLHLYFFQMKRKTIMFFCLINTSNHKMLCGGKTTWEKTSIFFDRLTKKKLN